MPIWAGLVLTSPVVAEPVSVNQGTGLGLVFQHNGNCYVVLPEHVHGRKRALSLRTAAPSAFGDARVFHSFSPGTDLSIGAILQDGLSGRCRQSWDSLPDRIDALLDQTAEAVLVRVSSSGAEERVPMRITGRDLSTLTARVAAETGKGAAIYQGTSGGILKIGDVVVGMAIQSANPTEALFLRIDEIKSVLKRLIDARGEGRDYAGDRPEPQGSRGRAACLPTPVPGFNSRAVPLRGIRCNREPMSPEQSCSRLTSGEGAAVMPADVPLEIVVELGGSSALPIDRVLLSKDEADEATAAPKSVLVEVDSASEGLPRWRRFGRGDMSPFGALTIDNGARPFAKRVRISVLSGWDAAKPIRLDCVSVLSADGPVSP